MKSISHEHGKINSKTVSKQIISTVFLTILTLLTMESQAQTFKTIDNKDLKLEVYNASENSFGVASVIVSGKKDAVLIDAQFTLADAEKIAQELKKSGKKLTTICFSRRSRFLLWSRSIQKIFPRSYSLCNTCNH